MWSEPGSVTKAEPPGCTVLKVAVHILLRSLLSLEEESGESGTGGGESGVPAVGPVERLSRARHSPALSIE